MKISIISGSHRNPSQSEKVARHIERTLQAEHTGMETWLYTLSVPMALGMPVVAFDLGAQAERLARYPRGVVLEETLMEDPVALNDALLRLDLDALWDAPHAVAFADNLALSEHFLARRRQAEAGTAAGRRAGSAPRSADPMALHS